MKLAVPTIFLLLHSALAQGIYLTDETGFAAGGFYGWYNALHQYGFKAALTFKGTAEASFTRMTLTDKALIDNFTHEFMVQFHAPKPSRFFLSLGLGRMYAKSRTELWRGFDLTMSSEATVFQSGVHVATSSSTNRRVMLSVSYRYLDGISKVIVPTTQITQNAKAHMFAFELGAVFFSGPLGITIGPGAAWTKGQPDLFVGLFISGVIRHEAAQSSDSTVQKEN